MLKKSDTLSSTLTRPSSQNSAPTVHESSKLDASDSLRSNTTNLLGSNNHESLGAYAKGSLCAGSADLLSSDNTNAVCFADKLACAKSTEATEKTEPLHQTAASSLLNTDSIASNNANDLDSSRSKIIHIEPKHKQVDMPHQSQGSNSTLNISNSNSFSSVDENSIADNTANQDKVNTVSTAANKSIKKDVSTDVTTSDNNIDYQACSDVSRASANLAVDNETKQSDFSSLHNLESNTAKLSDNNSTHHAESHADNNAENLNEAIYDGEQQSSLHTEKVSRRRVFLRSLQFRIIWIVTLAGLVSMTIMSVLSHNKINKSTHDFVDEELSQIASVAINYRMIIPRRWEAPRHYHDRVMRLMQQPDGSIIMQLSTEERQRQAEELAREPAKWFNEQERNAQNQAVNAQGSGNGYGAKRGYGAGQGYGAGRGYGAGQVYTQTDRVPQSTNPMQNWASQSGTPSLSDLYNLNYDIMIAPLYGRPGDALYIPLGVSDGFYTVMVADERVRAFVATNANGQRFVVARPLSSLVELMRQSFYASFLQFFLIDLIAIPLIIILSINFMLRSLNKLAQELYHRSDDDLSPVITSDGRQKGFIPSELDGFIISINRLFQRVDESMQSKQRFIADAAHEMRTQSTVLSLQIAALDKEELSPSARLKVKRLKDGIAREKNLMTSLLTLAREQGCSDVSLENINIFELYTKLIEEQGLVADHKNIDLGVEGEVNFNIISDRAKLTRIMSNLLSNAIKYTPEDGRIDLKAQQHPDGHLTLTVQDDGPGIPPEHLKHILEPFYRVDGDRSAVQGTGLGLAIVKASCDSLKAQLKFANASPHGLIASVTLKDLQDKTDANTPPNSQA